MAHRPASPAERAVSFGPFRLFPTQQLLLEGAASVRLGGRAFEILKALVERPGEVVEKSELMARVWPNSFVDENTLRVHIAGLRRALGDGQPGRRYLANVSGRGYCFVAPVDLSEPERPPIQPQEAPPSHNLPISKSRIVGRGAAIDALCEQLPRQGLVTIVGAGGIGKTTVALGVAEALLPTYPDGVRFVDLAPIEDPQFVASALGTALGMAVDPKNAIPRLVEFLHDKRMLIVLDSCEHVVEAAASLTEQILAGASGVQVLATSREPLRAEGERVHRLPPLEVPADQAMLTATDALASPAVQLFVERAAAILDGYELTDADAPIVSDICRRLGGMALAIELAAARTDAFGIRQLAALLDDRFRILKKGKRTAQPRHQSLAATLDWSYEFLPQSERLVLCRLSVFAGAFTLASAVAVAGDDDTDAVEVLANLVAKSLISADVGSATVHYRLLDTTRAYVMQKLIDSGEFENYARRHARHHFDWFKRAESDWATRPPGAQWLKDNGRGVDDVRSALTWAFSPDGDTAFGVALTVASLPLWLELSLVHECRAHVERALDAQVLQPDHDERDELKLRVAHGLVLPHASRSLSENEGFLAKTLALAERLGDREAQLRALYEYSAYFLYVGNFREALASAQRHSALAASGSLGYAHGIDVIGAMMIGNALRYLGDFAGAQRHIDSIINQPASPERSPFAYRLMALHVHSNLLWFRGFQDQAVRCARQVLTDVLTTSNSLMIVNILANAACPIALLVGDLAEAERLVAMLLDDSARSALNNWNALGRCYQGQLLLAQGNPAGLAILRSTLDWLRETGFVQHNALLLGALAEGLAAAGQLAEAHAAIGEALEWTASNDENWCFPELLRIKGESLRLSRDENMRETAEACFAKALAEARRQGALSWELRSATSMARLWRDDGKSAAAHELLSGVYNRFTEGFDALDLRTARTLIDELK